MPRLPRKEKPDHHLLVIGDCIEDRFEYMRKSYCRPGGALFVLQSLEAAFDESKNIISSAKALSTYNNKDDLTQRPVGHTQWQVKRYEADPTQSIATGYKKVDRCAPYPRASQSIHLNEEFPGYQLSQDNINQCTACLIEDLSLHQDMPAGPDELSASLMDRYSFKHALLPDTKQPILDAVFARLKIVADSRHAINNYLPLSRRVQGRRRSRTSNNHRFKRNSVCYGVHVFCQRRGAQPITLRPVSDRRPYRGRLAQGNQALPSTLHHRIAPAWHANAWTWDKRNSI
jgi:hypothetical protein